MTIPELLSNETLRRKEFPVCAERVFLAHAGDCPLPARVADAVANYARQSTTGDQEKFIYPAILEEGRALASSILKCAPGEVAFVGPTSLGLSLVASGLKFKRSDNILVYFDDYPSNVYPWMALAEQGLEVRFINIRDLGVIRPMDVLGQVDENTRLVALASCHFISGYRLDYNAIGEGLRKRKILFCLDAIQTVGAFPTAVENVDFLAADAHKWLLGPCGAGLLYIRKDLQENLNPPIYGWNNVKCPNFVAQESIVHRAASQKYEAGTHNLLGIVGLVESMKMITEVGIEAIAAELLRKRNFLVPALKGKGYSVLGEDAPTLNQSGIVTFFKPGQDLSALHQKLMDAQVVSSLRTDRVGQKYIRFSPHFYNSDAELQKAVGLV
jgi:selenocysteine lyase/cysteine desulfurase